MKALILALLLAPFQSTPDRNVHVYFYRERLPLGALLRPSLFVDGEEVARMRNGRYFVATIPAGKHTFSSTAKESDYTLDLEAGHTYFIRVEMTDKDRGKTVSKMTGRLTPVLSEQGIRETLKLNAAERNDLLPACTCDLSLPPSS